MLTPKNRTTGQDYTYIDIYNMMYVYQMMKENGDKADFTDGTYIDEYNKWLKKYETETIFSGSEENDHYYIDHENSYIVNNHTKDGGTDTFHSSVDITLPTHIENIVLSDWDEPVKQNFKEFGTCKVYGHPRNVLLDYVQGNEYKDFKPNLNLYEHLELSALPAMF